MRLRVTRTSRSIKTTQALFLDGKPPPEVVEGTLVLYRIPAADGAPRWSPTEQDFDAVLRLCKRLALIIGDNEHRQLWHTSVVSQPPQPLKEGGGWTVRTENDSIYRVEVLGEGKSVRPVRRATGSFPIYDPESQK